MLPVGKDLTALVRDELESHGLPSRAGLVPLAGGMNSWTARVRTPDLDAIVKCVPLEDAQELRRGAEVSAALADQGLVTGRPIPSRDGELVRVLPWGAMTLMEYVPGRELTAGPEDQRRLAEGLSQVHAAGGLTLRQAPFMSYLGDDPALARHGAWILPAIHAAVGEYRSLPPTPWGTINGDPSLDSFLLDESTGRLGIIDWAGPETTGPVLYDVASAVMYVGGLRPAAPFLAAYTRAGLLDRTMLDAHLPVFRRFRAAVQADYFARRLSAGDATGISDLQENSQGLEDARGMLEEFDD